MGLVRIIRYHFHCVMTPTNILFLSLTFIVNTLLVYFTYTDAIPTTDIQATAFMFYLPINLRFDLFRWILILLPVLLILGSFINNEIKERTTYVLLHMKNFRQWFYSVTIVCFSFITLTFLIGFVITFGLVSLIPRDVVSNEWLEILNFFYQLNVLKLIVHQFCLLLLTIFLLVLVNILFTFLLNNSSFAFLLTVISEIASITVGYISPDLLKWLPLTHGLLAFHELNNYSFVWSYIYLILNLLILYVLIFRVFMIRRESLFMTKEN